MLIVIVDRNVSLWMLDAHW